MLPKKNTSQLRLCWFEPSFEFAVHYFPFKVSFKIFNFFDNVVNSRPPFYCTTHKMEYFPPGVVASQDMPQSMNLIFPIQHRLLLFIFLIPNWNHINQEFSIVDVSPRNQLTITQKISFPLFPFVATTNHPSTTSRPHSLVEYKVFLEYFAHSERYS